MQLADRSQLLAQAKQPYVSPMFKAITIEKVGFFCVSGVHNAAKTEEEDWDAEEKIGGGDVEINL